MKRTKIICTIGPACDETNVLEKMMEAGMDVARLNFSHGTHDEHEKRIVSIRKAAAGTGKNIAVLMDTKGPEVRLGRLDKPVQLAAGQKIILSTGESAGSRQCLPVSYANLPREVCRGNIIFIADGEIELKVLSAGSKEVDCEVVHGGVVTSHKGVNLPGVSLDLPVITEKDREDILFGIKHNLDIIAVSFVRSAGDILAVRQMLEEADSDMYIIAKIESRKGLDNLEEIIKVADGIMVARGDLGIGISVEEVPLVQKTIIKKCNLAGKPVVTATQMLESMMNNPRPTRAEAADVANAILDGTDAIMLSGETAIGRFPVNAVETMARIADKVEAALPYDEILERKGKELARTVTDAISHATCTASRDLEAAAIITLTKTGHTARMVSKYRPQAPIIAITPQAEIMRKLALIWGVQPLLVALVDNTDNMINAAIEVSLASNLIKTGDLVVITAGAPVGVHGTTNLLRVHIEGEILARGSGIGQYTVTGQVKICHTLREAVEKIQPGNIMVVHYTDRDYLPVVRKCSALITEVGGLTSHGAITGLELNIPVVVGVEAAMTIFQDGEIITVDGQRGLVYKGAARAL